VIETRSDMYAAQTDDPAPMTRPLSPTQQDLNRQAMGPPASDVSQISERWWSLSVSNRCGRSHPLSASLAPAASPPSLNHPVLMSESV
jgi:hypothetical protein